MMLETILAFPEKIKICILSPIARGKKGEFQKELKKLLKDGYVRVRIDGELRELAMNRSGQKQASRHRRCR